ncbi:MAG: hypothetical protein MK135_08040, partial [Polyangiaceae bacterium]|nr:hypothetical protein [Polyangiaceae bacterium]
QALQVDDDGHSLSPVTFSGDEQKSRGSGQSILPPAPPRPWELEERLRSRSPTPAAEEGAAVTDLPSFDSTEQLSTDAQVVDIRDSLLAPVPRRRTRGWQWLAVAFASTIFLVGVVGGAAWNQEGQNWREWRALAQPEPVDLSQAGDTALLESRLAWVEQQQANPPVMMEFQEWQPSEESKTSSSSSSKAVAAAPRAKAQRPATGAGPAVRSAPAGSITRDEEPIEEKVPGFNKSAAKVALVSATSHAGSCRRPGDPSGMAQVVVVFSPSGRVTSATVSGKPFAGTPTGGCIASRFRAIRVPAFTGEFVTVRKRVLIQ